MSSILTVGSRALEMVKRRLRIDRLVRREENATIRRIVYLTVVSVILGVIFFALGIPFLGKFADFLSGVLHGKDSSQESSAPQAPILDDLPSSTNSARLVIRGFSSEGKKVEVYLDNEKITVVDVLDSHFNYDDLRLKEGANTINVKSVNDTGKTSNSSQNKTVVYDTKEPKLEIESPTDDQNFISNNRIRVLGKTDNDAQVYANGFLASVNADGKFEVFVPVGEGETTIEIKAIDPAGNEKVEKRKINFHK